MRLWVDHNPGEERDIFQWFKDATTTYYSLLQVQVCLLTISEDQMQGVALKMLDTGYSGKHSYLIRYSSGSIF